jgi:hypothetical protein
LRHVITFDSAYECPTVLFDGGNNEGELWVITNFICICCRNLENDAWPLIAIDKFGWFCFVPFCLLQHLEALLANLHYIHFRELFGWQQFL